MRKALWAIMILVLFGVAGYLIYSITGSDAAAYIVSVIGSATGLAGLFITLRTKDQSRGRGISLQARRVGRGGKVTGVDGLPMSKTPPSDVNVDAERIQGDVAGARYA